MQEAERESEVGLGEWPRDLFWNDRGAASSIMSLKSPKSFPRMDESEIDVEGIGYFTVRSKKRITPTFAHSKIRNRYEERKCTPIDSP